MTNNSFKSIAIQILKESKEPLHYKEITRLAKEKKLLKSDGKTPWATMNAQLSTDIVNNGENSRFYRAQPGYFGLRELGVTKTSTNEEYIQQIEQELALIKEEATTEEFLTQSLTSCKNCNFIVFECDDSGRFVQFWLGDGKIMANWPLTGKNRLRNYTYAMLGVLNELGITCDFKRDGKWPKLHHCYTLATNNGFPEYVVNFGRDGELASRFTALVLQEVFKKKLDSLSYKIG